MSEKDLIYSEPLSNVASFAFDSKVASVFPDMIQRSVPGYSTIIAMTGVLAEQYAQSNSHCYDLGCSLGASSLSIRQHIAGRQCTIIAVDNSAAMLERFNQAIAEDSARHGNTTPVQSICADIQNVDISNASVVVLNFTLQFVGVDQPKALLQNIYNGMRDGGIFILSEKIKFDDEHLQTLNTELHHSFKRGNGYSEMEISQKRTALENVLIPETIPAHQQRLRDIGFSSVDVWFQCFNFASLVAIK